MPPDTQLCPICSKTVAPYPRYPHYVCGECEMKATSEDGRPVKFYNTSWLGTGCRGEYTDTGEQYLSEECYIDGVKCNAKEAYFGGIVIQVSMD